MPTVRDAVVRLLADLGMTTIFGNPGSTELPLLRDFPAERLAFISVGLFRYMPDLGAIIRKRFPYHPALSSEFFPDEDGKYHYFRGIRKEMYERFADWLKYWRDVPIFWSMEPDQSLYR